MVINGIPLAHFWGRILAHCSHMIWPCYQNMPQNCFARCEFATNNFAEGYIRPNEQPVVFLPYTGYHTLKNYKRYNVLTHEGVVQLHYGYVIILTAIRLVSLV